MIKYFFIVTVAPLFTPLNCHWRMHRWPRSLAATGVDLIILTVHRQRLTKFEVPCISYKLRSIDLGLFVTLQKDAFFESV